MKRGNLNFQETSIPVQICKGISLLLTFNFTFIYYVQK
jgi:hypothetical protein